MRTLRSLGATISSTPLFLPCCPIRQRRPSSTPKSSIEVPCNDLKVTTTSWSVVLASRSASFCVSAARVAWSRTLASSTTRPLSAGRTSANAGSAASHSKAQKSSARLARRRRPSSARRLCARSREGAPCAERGPASAWHAALTAQPSELHLRRPGHVFGDRERLHGLVAPVERRGPDDAGECAQLRVVLPHRFDVVAPGDSDAVLRAFELRLQREEVLVRFQIGIALRHREQPPERAGELRLRLLEALERFRIVDDVRRNLQLHLGRARPRVGHLFQDLPFLRGVALHGLDQIGNEIGAALILVEHLRPLRLGAFLIARNVVDAAAREQQAEACDQHGNAGKTPYA